MHGSHIRCKYFLIYFKVRTVVNAGASATAIIGLIGEPSTYFAVKNTNAEVCKNTTPHISKYMGRNIYNVGRENTFASISNIAIKVHEAPTESLTRHTRS